MAPKNYGPPNSHPAKVIQETTDKQFVSQAEKDYWNLKVPGPKGDQGDPGITPDPAQERFTSLVFMRSATPPGTPTGGDYASPIPDGALWSDGIPTGTDPLYISKRLFTSDGAYPQEWDWSIPVLFLSEGVDGAPGPGSRLRIIFSTSETEPAVPATPDSTEGWYTSAISTAIWMSQQVNTTDENGTVTSYGSWDPPIKIKGEPGDPGETGAAGVSIQWLGEATSHPANPEEGDAYRNTSDGKSYVYRDATWYQMTQDGVDGAQGYSRAIITLYQKNTSDTTPPSDPTGTFTYTFATAALTGGTLNGWSLAPPSVDTGEYLWAIQATAVANTATDDIASSEFSDAVLAGITGNDGAPGLNSATVYLYRKNTSDTVAPALFSGTFTYTFSTGTLSGGTLNGWTQTPPSIVKGEVLWRAQATASSTNTTDSVAAAEFSTPTVHTLGGVDGAPGLSITWMGDLSNAPSPATENMAYRDLEDGIVYICTAAGDPGTWAVMVYDGNDGTPGAQGDNGLSVSITYHDADADGTPPTKPTTILGDNLGWHTAATAQSNWMSQKVDDGTTANWSDAIRIVGNNAIGAIPISFAPGKVGGSGDFTFHLNQLAGGTANPGELRVVSSEFLHPDGTTRFPTSKDATVATNYGEGTAGKYYVMWTDTAPQTRFTSLNPSNFDHDNLCAVIPIDGQWYVIDNADATEAFTPLATDCLIAVVEAAATSGGLTSVVPLVGALVGINTATVILYQRTNSLTPPTGPAAALTYTFATGVLESATPWTPGFPDYSPSLPYLWYIQAQAISRETTDAIQPGDWSIASRANANGEPGTDGARGGLKFFLEESQANAPYTTPTDVDAWCNGLTAIAAQNIARDLMLNWAPDGYLRPLDQVTIQDLSVGIMATRAYIGSPKNDYSQVLVTDFSTIVTELIDGSLIVDGSVSTDKIIAGSALLTSAHIGDLESTALYNGQPRWELNRNGSLIIRNTDGSILFQSGGTIDYSKVSGTKPPDQITEANATTYIADGAIGSAKIGSLDVAKLSGDTYKKDRTGIIAKKEIGFSGWNVWHTLHTFTLGQSSTDRDFWIQTLMYNETVRVVYPIIIRGYIPSGVATYAQVRCNVRLYCAATGQEAHNEYCFIPIYGQVGAQTASITISRVSDSVAATVTKIFNQSGDSSPVFGSLPGNAGNNSQWSVQIQPTSIASGVFTITGFGAGANGTTPAYDFIVIMDIWKKGQVGLVVS